MLAKASGAEALHREAWECSCSRASARVTVEVNWFVPTPLLYASLLVSSYEMNPRLNRASHILEVWLHLP